MKDIEQMLHKLPTFEADPLFKDKLKQRIVSAVKPRPKFGWLPQLGLVFSVLILAVGLYIFTNTPKTPETSQLSDAGVQQQTEEKVSLSAPAVSDASKNAVFNISLGTGFKFFLPESWSAKISDQSNTHFVGRFFLPGVSPETTYVDIESTTNTPVVNPLLAKTNETSKKINGLTAAIVEGRENFGVSNRLIKQVTLKHTNSHLIVTLYREPTVAVEETFDTFVNSVSESQKLSHTFELAKQVWAAEAIAGIDIGKFKEIQVMGDPLPERLTAQDTPYKDGYAKFYKFQAFKGQRLTTVALEDRTTNSNSFIKTELYGENGTELYSIDTRIEFDAPYTGTYYYIVRSFSQREGGYLLKVFDEDQTHNLVYIKYDDGSEKLLNARMGDIQMGEREVVLVMQFINPIEIVGETSVRYYAESREFEPPLGLITTPIEVFMKPGSYAEDILGPHADLPEDDRANLVNIKLTLLSPSKILIEPEAGGMFPTLHHIVITELNIGRYRFFTENSQ